MPAGTKLADKEIKWKKRGCPVRFLACGWMRLPPDKESSKPGDLESRMVLVSQERGRLAKPSSIGQPYCGHSYQAWPAAPALWSLPH